MSDRHAYLKLDYVARFDFDYLDLPNETQGYMPRATVDGGMAFNPDTLERVPGHSDPSLTAPTGVKLTIQLPPGLELPS